MAGEIWRNTSQMGVENPAAYGTPVAATRIGYFRDPKFSNERDPRLHKVMAATREGVRNVSLGPSKIGGSLVQAVSAEMLELLLIGMKGAVSPVGVGLLKTWTFTPDPTLASATFEWQDGARAWQIAGCYADSLKIAGSVAGENLVTAELFGKAMILNALTGGLTQRVPAVFEGWESAIYIDSFGGTPGSTIKAGLLIDWDIALKNNLGRKYFADNVNSTGAVVIGDFEVEASLKIEASAAQAATEYANWDAATKRLVRLVFGNNTDIAVNEIQTLTITGAPDGGTFTISFGGQTTAAIAYNASAADVQAALRLLSTIGTSGVVCAGGPLPTTGVTITFSGTSPALANTDVAMLTTADSLTGGTAPATAVAETLKGGARKETVTIDLPGAWTAFGLSGEEGGTRVYELKLAAVYDPTNTYSARVVVQTARSAAWST